MTDDATLSDFASTTDDSESGDGSSADSESAVDGDDESAPLDDRSRTVTDDTGLSTYAWGEYTCSRCERHTDRVWRADGGLVCPDCKEW